MLRSIRHSSMLALFAALAFAGGSVPVLAAQPAMTSTAPRPARAGNLRMSGVAIRSFSRYGRKGAGITMAQQRRAVAKKRNVARNRRHH
jgi:hypothetical protein